ncbi:MAG: SCO family protein [Verrucomicrobia bacterium]|nr:SCO family protein [Verrucomicrobiota bacterium]
MNNSNSNSPKVQWLVWGFLSLTILAITSAFIWTRLMSPGRPLPVISEVRPFTLTNQLGQSITLDSLRGQVWIADIIFTRCPGPCAKLTRQLAVIQNALRDEHDVRFVSLTADPTYDTPAVLQRYAKRFGANQERWHFLTGLKSDIYRMAHEDLKLIVEETKPEDRTNVEDLFLHSTQLMLVDRHGRVRANFNGDFPEFDQQTLPALAETVRALLKEK